MRNFLTLILFGIFYSQVFYTDLPDSTGIYQPIIIENCLGLDIGDEIGLFDQNGLVSNDCSDEYSEILVGSAVYDGNQLTINGFGSIDFCDIPNGYQLPGWIGGHNISIKVWDASSNIEYVPEVNYVTGSGEWGDIFSVIDQLVVEELSIYTINNFTLFDVFPNPFNSTISIRVNNNLINPYRVQIFNLSGKLIETIDFKSFYDNSINWDASNLKSGIYLVNFSSNNNSLTKKITLIK